MKRRALWLRGPHGLVQGLHIRDSFILDRPKDRFLNFVRILLILKFSALCIVNEALRVLGVQLRSLRNVNIANHSTLARASLRPLLDRF